MLPGLETHGIALKLIGDAMKVRNRVIARLEEASVTEDPAHRARLCHFVIVGGGFSGVEVAGEIHDFLRAARRHYPAIPEELLRVCVVHAGERILPEVSPKLSRRAADNMTARGIELLLNAKASGADETGLDVDIPDGRERLDTATVISTIGTGPNPVIGALDLGMEKGRLRTEADMSVPGAEGLWALGDCAAVPNAASGETSPPTAQFALRQADDLARNIQAREAGQETRDFDFDGYGTIATIGSKRGVAEVMGVPVTGFPAWLLWRAVYLFRMPTLSRKVQIYVAWTWAMLFPSDIAQLRFTASDAADRR
jgi:NADH dehydrogenase